MTQHFNPDDLLITSHSIDGTYENCARRFEFLHAYMSAPEYESSAFAADVGTALHEATQEWARLTHSGADPKAAYEAGALILLRWWPWAEEQRRLENSLPIGRRNLGNAILMYEEIINSPIWSEWELVKVDGFGPAIEVPWRIVHTSLGKVPVRRGKGIKQVWIATQGKIDFILRNRKTGKFRVLDLKTTEKAKPSHDAAFRFSGQAGQYGVVLDHALGLDWANQGLDIIYLIAHFGELENEVYPIHYHLDAEEVADSIDIKVERLNRMKAQALAEHFPRRSHGCEFYGSPCGFLDICHRRDPEYVREWLNFEEATGRFKKYERVYEPVWTLES